MHQLVNNDKPSIRFVRMNTGEDLISEIIKRNEDGNEFYTFINPLKIVYLQGEKKGSLMLSFIEWVFPRISPFQEFPIYPSDIITIAECSEDITDYYFEALYKFSQVEYDIGIDKVKSKQSKPEKDLFEDNREITEEEVEYIKKYFEEISNGKRKLH